MFRDVLDLHGGGCPDGNLPRRGTTRALLAAEIPTPGTTEVELHIVVPDLAEGRKLELHIRGVHAECGEWAREIVERPSVEGTVLPVLEDLERLEELVHESGATVVIPSGGNYYDEVARYIEREIGRLAVETLRDVINVCEVAPGILHLTFPNQALLADTMLRFQEHYESPRFHSTVFSREDFAAWYRATQPHGGFSYHFDWPGFNVPARCFEPFTRGDFRDLSTGERIVLEKIAAHPATKMVIATVEGGDPDTFRHEFAHGLFETVPEYRTEALRIVSRIERGPLYQILESQGYAPHTWDDEVQAYLIGDLEELVNDHPTLEAWSGVGAELRELLERYRTFRPGSP